MSYDIKCSMDVSTSAFLRDLRKDEMPGAATAVAAGISRKPLGMDPLRSNQVHEICVMTFAASARCVGGREICFRSAICDAQVWEDFATRFCAVDSIEKLLSYARVSWKVKVVVS